MLAARCSSGAEAVAHFLEQELAEERVVVVGGLRPAPPVGEEVAAVEVLEQAPDIVPARQRHRVRLRERRRDRGQHQRALVLGLCGIEDLPGEVLEDRLLAFGERGVECSAVPAQVLAQQHQRRDPAVALALDPLEIRRSELRVFEDGFGFLGIAAQLRLIDERDPPVRDQACEFRRRLGPRHDDERDAFGNLFEPLRQCGALPRRRARLVEVVEDDGARVRQDREEIAEEAAREAREILLQVGRVERQRRRRLARDLLRGDPHVVDERRRIGVADVDLVPEMSSLADLEPARDERRLPGSRRRADPDDRAGRRVVEQREQPRPRERVVELRAGELGEGGRAGGHGGEPFV